MVASISSHQLSLSFLCFFWALFKGSFPNSIKLRQFGPGPERANCHIQQNGHSPTRAQLYLQYHFLFWCIGFCFTSCERALFFIRVEAFHKSLWIILLKFQGKTDKIQHWDHADSLDTSLTTAWLHSCRHPENNFSTSWKW